MPPRGSQLAPARVRAVGQPFSAESLGEADRSPKRHTTSDLGTSRASASRPQLLVRIEDRAGIDRSRSRSRCARRAAAALGQLRPLLGLQGGRHRAGVAADEASHVTGLRRSVRRRRPSEGVRGPRSSCPRPQRHGQTSMRLSTPSTPTACAPSSRPSDGSNSTSVHRRRVPGVRGRRPVRVHVTLEYGRPAVTAFARSRRSGPAVDSNLDDAGACRSVLVPTGDDVGAIMP